MNHYSEESQSNASDKPLSYETASKSFSKFYDRAPTSVKKQLQNATAFIPLKLKDFVFFLNPGKSANTNSTSKTTFFQVGIPLDKIGGQSVKTPSVEQFRHNDNLFVFKGWFNGNCHVEPGIQASILGDDSEVTLTYYRNLMATDHQGYPRYPEAYEFFTKIKENNYEVNKEYFRLKDEKENNIANSQVCDDDDEETFISDLKAPPSSNLNANFKRPAGPVGQYGNVQKHFKK